MRFSIKVVCLEFVPDSTKYTFIGALQRFINRTWRPATIFGDNDFIPFRSPYFGELWEAAVKSAKHHLKKVINRTSLTYGELQTVATEVEITAEVVTCEIHSTRI